MAGRIRRIVKTFIDIPSWIGARNIIDTTEKLKSRIASLFVVPEHHRDETFEEALQRLHLTENDLEQRVQEFSRLLSFYLVLGSGFFIYWIYLIWHKHWLSVGIVVAILALLFSQIFRYHFWLYQIQQQKLGARFEDWVKYCMGKRT